MKSGFYITIGLLISIFSFAQKGGKYKLWFDKPAKQWVEAIQEYANITELDAATLNRLIKEIVVHERIDEDKTRHISIEIHFNLKPIPEVEQVTA